MGAAKHELVLPDGRSMIDAVVGVVDELCRDVVIACGAEPIESRRRQIADRSEGRGPLGGIDALLASGIDDEFIVCPCDVPLVTAALLARLTVPTSRPATCFHVEREPAPRPLPLRISVSAAPTVGAALDAGRRAVHQVLEALDVEIVALSAGEAALLHNVNTPEEFRALSPAAPPPSQQPRE